jgi:hypothetical protein
VELVEMNASTPPPARRLAEILFGDRELLAEPARLGEQLERVRDQVDRLELLIRDIRSPGGSPAGGDSPAAAAPTAGGYVLFVPTPDGYAIRDGEGACPAPGDRLEGLIVVRLGPSPLPGDRRVCVFLAPDPSGPDQPSG